MKRAHGCMSCGAPLEYLSAECNVRCVFCGNAFRASALCADGHFVCDACHREDGLAAIERICLETRETDMLSLLTQIRSHRAFPVHGPEHHSLVPAVILAAYRNLGGELPAERLRLGIRRGTQVPGGACGRLGTCGAAVGVGIAFAVILESTPLKGEARGASMLATSRVLEEIARLKAPRCCQRESFLALEQAARLSRQLLPIALQADAEISCAQVELNDECIGAACPLFDPAATTAAG